MDEGLRGSSPPPSPPSLPPPSAPLQPLQLVVVVEMVEGSLFSLFIFPLILLKWILSSLGGWLSARKLARSPGLLPYFVKGFMFKSFTSD